MLADLTDVQSLVVSIMDDMASNLGRHNVEATLE